MQLLCMYLLNFDSNCPQFFVEILWRVWANVKHQSLQQNYHKQSICTEDKRRQSIWQFLQNRKTIRCQSFYYDTIPFLRNNHEIRLITWFFNVRGWVMKMKNITFDLKLIFQACGTDRSWLLMCEESLVSKVPSKHH